MPAYMQNVGEVIHAVARREDSELRRYSGKGILSMPELAYVHQVAKELSCRPDEVFGVATIGWEMNRDIGGGLTDLIVTPHGGNGKKLALEFKLGGQSQKWVDDVAKLRKINALEYDRAFFALADVFVSDLGDHSRIGDVDRLTDVERIGKELEFFTTLSDYVTQTCCVVVGWWVHGNT